MPQVDLANSIYFPLLACWFWSILCVPWCYPRVETYILDLLESTLNFYFYTFQQCMNFYSDLIAFAPLLPFVPLLSYIFCLYSFVCPHFYPFQCCFFILFHGCIWDHFHFTISTPFSNASLVQVCCTFIQLLFMWIYFFICHHFERSFPWV